MWIRHLSFTPSFYSTASLVFWVIRKITNSAGFTGSNANHTDQMAVVNVVLTHGLPAHTHIEGLLRSGPRQRTAPPQAGQEHADRPLHAHPQRLVIWLKYDPARVGLDGLFNENEQAADIDIFPQRIAACGSRPPKPGFPVPVTPGSGLRPWGFKISCSPLLN